MMKKSILFILLYLITSAAWSQISGIVTDTEGSPLPYATIYVENTSIGTSTNSEGNFDLNISDKSKTLVFQYVGYTTVKYPLQNVTNFPKSIEIKMKVQSQGLDQITIAADAEDPAYQIIRNAIANRKKNQKELEDFSADAYIKGLVRINDAPSKFMGVNLGDMEGILDSTRNGIVYLSESKSKVYSKAPGKFKEELYASKVSGDMDAISFNQFADVNFSFYNEFIRFNRNLVSPLADQSFRYYKFKLLQSFVDENGKQINKIEVIPKRANDPIFSGIIYIMDENWRIHSTDLFTTGLAAKNTLFESLSFKQIYIPTIEGKWVLFSQVLEFQLKILSFRFNGYNTCFLTDYNFDNIEDSFFTREIFKADSDASKRDSVYWEKVRPVSISLEEQKDYNRKDSLELLRNSRPYRDSVDRASNKFKVLDLLFGYTYSNSFKKQYISFISPLNSFLFNAVQGFNLNLEGRIRKWNKDETSYFMVEPKLNYGFKEKRFRPKISISKRFNSIYYPWLSLSLGRELRQINTQNPMSIALNSIESLWYKNHYLKLYESDFASIQFTREWDAGLRSNVKFEHQKRRALVTNSEYSFRRKDQEYQSNNPWFEQTGSDLLFQDNTLTTLNIGFRFRPKQTYMTYGNERYRQRSDWPDFVFNYIKAFKFNSEAPSFDKVTLGIIDRRTYLNLWGYMSYNLEVGHFLTKENVGKQDFFHFNGNQSTLMIDPNLLNRFMLLRDYSLSTDGSYFKSSVEFHLEGKLFDKIPFLKNTDMSSVLGYRQLQTTEGQFHEISFGIENIKLFGIPLLKLDYAWSFGEGTYRKHGLFISSTSSF